MSIAKAYYAMCDEGLENPDPNGPQCLGAKEFRATSKDDLFNTLRSKGWAVIRNACYGDGASDPKWWVECPSYIAIERT